MKNNNKQQAVKTFYSVMNYLVMEQKNSAAQLPVWFTELSARIKNNFLIEEELTEIYYQLDQKLTSTFGAQISKTLIPNRFMA